VPPSEASCDAQSGVPAFRPFKILSVEAGSVNMCNRPGAVGCSADAQTPYHDAFATSYFKMSKMYAIGGRNQGMEYGVQTQPCQVRPRGRSRGGGGGSRCNKKADVILRAKDLFRTRRQVAVGVELSQQESANLANRLPKFDLHSQTAAPCWLA
jgi:hypothetical protein